MRHWQSMKKNDFFIHSILRICNLWNSLPSPITCASEPLVNRNVWLFVQIRDLIGAFCLTFPYDMTRKRHKVSQNVTAMSSEKNLLRKNVMRIWKCCYIVRQNMLLQEGLLKCKVSSPIGHINFQRFREKRFPWVLLMEIIGLHRSFKLSKNTCNLTNRALPHLQLLRG